MDLKIGGSNVGKIMYGGQEFGGATKLEPGTILYIALKKRGTSFEDAHLLSTTKKWENINGINIASVSDNNVNYVYDDVNISSDDFKNLDTKKEYKMGGKTVTVSRSIVDGEYRLNVWGFSELDTIAVKAI